MSYEKLTQLPGANENLRRFFKPVELIPEAEPKVEEDNSGSSNDNSDSGGENSGSEDDDSGSGGDANSNGTSKASAMVHALDIVYPDHTITYEEGFKQCVEYALKLAMDNTDPKSYWEAMTRPDAQKWKEAAQAEMQAPVKNGTWDFVKLPSDRKAVGSKWVFKVKRNAEGTIKRYKSRLVAQGFSQRPGLDFIEDQTFAPTMQFADIRAILALAAIED
jgi:hypothetical protein